MKAPNNAEMKVLFDHFFLFPLNREEPSMIKTRPKIIDRQNPVVRSSTHTPPGLAQRLPGLLRPVTAKAALQRQPLPLSRQPKT